MKQLYITAAACLLWLVTMAQTSPTTQSTPNARALIYIYLDGGAAQTDTFDPKPEAGRDYYGKYRVPIKTSVEGIYISEKLPRLAAMADQYSIIRSMTHGSNAHETAHYIMQTGDMTGSGVVYPSFGSMISYLKAVDYHGNLFPYITLTAASTRFNEAGFLPSQYKAFDTGGAPEAKSFDVDGVVNSNVTTERLRQKRELLEIVESEQATRITRNVEVQRLKQLREKTYELILGDEREVFDLTQESDLTRESYGINRFGQSCLAARRLIEKGVLVVMVRFTGWDTHKEHFARMDERLTELDKGVSSLLADLKQRGMLDNTIVMCGGEFGRTPKIMWEPPWNGGRGHYGKAFSYLVAGGGFMGGIALGKTDAKGENVVERPVYPCDLIGTVYTLMGIDPHSKIDHPRLGAIPLLPSLGQESSSNGLVTELIKK